MPEARWGGDIMTLHIQSSSIACTYICRNSFVITFGYQEIIRRVRVTLTTVISLPVDGFTELENVTDTQSVY